MIRVDDKIILVTGGGSGIGRASCEVMATAGAQIIVSDINFKLAEETAAMIQECGNKAVAVQHDVTNGIEWKSVIDYCLLNFNKLDVLVNNAGIDSNRPASEFEDMLFDEWRKILSVNLDGVFLGSQNAVSAMARNEGTGSIVNVSSIMGIVGGSNAAYNASKGGVRLLTKSVAAICGRKGYNIRVNSIHPGFVRTPFIEKYLSENEENIISRHPIGRLGLPLDIANGVLFLASDDSSFMTGSELIIDGGYTAV